eukprot:scaffold22381_cov29-Attheya_sp.AAC.1
MDEQTKSRAVLISTIAALDKADKDEWIAKYKKRSCQSNQVQSDLKASTDEIDIQPYRRLRFHSATFDG